MPLYVYVTAYYVIIMFVAIYLYLFSIIIFLYCVWPLLCILYLWYYFGMIFNYTETAMSTDLHDDESSYMMK